MDLVLLERRGAVGVVTLNRPEKLNALNRELVRQLGEALSALDDDESIGAIVLTGAGERAFSAGGDMREQVAALDQQRAPPPPPPPPRGGGGFFSPQRGGKPGPGAPPAP